VQFRREKPEIRHVDSFNAYPEAMEKLQVQEQRMQNKKGESHGQLARPSPRSSKGKTRLLQFEKEKLRCNELRQMLERHQR